MPTSIPARVHAYFEHQFGTTMQALLQPIDALAPSGPSERGNGVYQAMNAARSQDDASLPMGPWQHELKRADWSAAGRIAVDALCCKSKDLQLAVWLLEAQMHERGLEGIAPALLLMAELVDRFWDDLHPQPQGDDFSHRANLLRWVNRRLLAPLKLIPLTAGGPGREFAWADLEQALRHERPRAVSREDASVDAADNDAAADTAALAGALAATPAAKCQAMNLAVSDALDALAALSAAIDRRFTQDAPSLGAFNGVLQDMQAWLGAELRRRGMPKLVAAPAVPAPTPEVAPAARPAIAVVAAPAAPQSPMQREQAYAMLAIACEALRRAEPHSPVPYVVQRAIAWGSLNTAELYQELFVRMGGQINIFELLGIAQEPIAEPAA